MRSIIKELSFSLGLGFLISHELDAVVQSEWKLLYILRDLPNSQAMSWFILLHVPLFSVIIHLLYSNNTSIRHKSRIAFSMFLIIHSLLHYRLSDNELYTFHSPLSITMIYGGALCGAIYLLLAYVNKSHKKQGDNFKNDLTA